MTLLFFILAYFGFIPVHLKNQRLLKKALCEKKDEVLTRDRVLIAAFIGVALTSYFNPFLILC